MVTIQHRQEYRELGQSFWLVKVIDQSSLAMYSAMVNLDDDTIVDDLEAVRKAEIEAQRAHYGKLSPSLFERLEAARDDQEVTVFIWLAGSPQRSEPELYALLADKYPEAKAALERTGDPFLVEDRELASRMRIEYVDMLTVDTMERIEPLLKHLQERGYTAATFGAMPGIVVTLPKRAILELEPREDVGQIDLDLGPVVPMSDTPAGVVAEPEQLPLDTGVPSNRAPVVWQRGYKGDGIRLAILETGHIDNTRPGGGDNWLNIVSTYETSGTTCIESDHKTEVAGCAASQHPFYTGMAPEADVIDFCVTTAQQDAVWGLRSALDNSIADADVVNYSMGVAGTGSMTLFDRAFDYWSRVEDDLVVVPAGNEGAYIAAPANGYNILTVGGSDNHDTTQWGDDTIYEPGNHQNLIGTEREKPEIVAPAASLRMVSIDGATVVYSGTSYAAPQVAGLSALLMQRSSWLMDATPALRSIIMASATENVDGPRGLMAGTDLQDGIGSIDAALADAIANHPHAGRPDDTPMTASGYGTFEFTNSGYQNWPVGTYIWYNIRAVRGERIRVALNWWSCPTWDGTLWGYADWLATDLDLVVQDPDGNIVPGGTSTSIWNNYEFVEFIAQKTGVYRLGLLNDQMQESANEVGIAWVKEGIYLPDIKANYQGEDSEIVIRNDSSFPQPVSVAVYDSSGVVQRELNLTNLAARCVWRYSPRRDAGLTNFRGSALVSSGEDVSVMVRNLSPSGAPTQVSAYTGIRAEEGSSDISWETEGAYLKVPWVYRDTALAYTTTLTVLNTNVEDNDVWVQWRYGNGQWVYADSYARNIPPMGSATITPPTFLTNFQGSALVRSEGFYNPLGPLAVVANTRKNNGTTDFSLDGSNHASEFWLPYLARNDGGWNACFAVRNDDTTSVPVYVTYYYSGGPRTETLTTSLAVDATIVTCVQNNVNLPNGVLAAKVWTTSGDHIVVGVKLTNSLKNFSYNGIAQPSKSVIIPYAAKNYSVDGKNWKSYLAVQNAGSQTTQIQVTYRRADDYVPLTQIYTSVAAGRTTRIDLNGLTSLPTNFEGSIEIVAQPASEGSSYSPLAAMTYAECTSCTSDNYYGTNGVNR